MNEHGMKWRWDIGISAFIYHRLAYRRLMNHESDL